MTDEQIKQNAEIYARYGSRARNTAYYAYIAGAHSRDEEILKLKENVEAMESYIESEKACMQDEIDKMQEQLKMNAENFQKLHHPWISVEDGLPERHTPVYAKNNNKAWFFALMTDNKQRPWYNIVGRCGEKVTHWKPIHELEKGE